MPGTHAKLSRRVAVGSNAGLERGGAVNDEHEKDWTRGAPAVFQTLNGILNGTTVLEPFTVEQSQGTGVIWLG